MKSRRFVKWIFSALFSFSLVACALSGGFDEGGSGDDSGMMDAPCSDCGTRGEIKLSISKEKFYREWNPKAYSRIDSNAVMGVFPALQVIAKRPEVCKFCHSFSEDALDFDLSRVEDSLFVVAFPKMQRELMLPGMRVPEADSSYIDSISKKIANVAFADGKPMGDMSPWVERAGVEQAFERSAPQTMKNLLMEISARYNVRYISMPIKLAVTMDTDLGKSGGYSWTVLWTMWDARYGELVFLTYSEFTAETTSRVAPEKEWAEPFAARLWKMFAVDFSKLEAH